jgi:hypothetical protein
MEGSGGRARQGSIKKTMVKFVWQCKMQIHGGLTVGHPLAQTNLLDVFEHVHVAGSGATGLGVEHGKQTEKEDRKRQNRRK